MKYDFGAVEAKWQARWEEAGAFLAADKSEKPKFYLGFYHHCHGDNLTV